jgi:hypothetical protein
VSSADHFEQDTDFRSAVIWNNPDDKEGNINTINVSMTQNSML